MADGRKSRVRDVYRKARESKKTRDFLVLLIFIAIAAVFWYIMALNDEMQKGYDVGVEIDNVPDSVTFITIPPSRLQVNVRDRGLNIMRHRISGVPKLQLDFREHAEDGRFRVTHAALQAAMRRVFGSSATISSITPDSLSLVYTTYPGQRLPLELDYDVTVAPGMVLGTPRLSTDVVDLFSTTKSDTLRRLYTDKVMLRNLDRNTTVSVPVVCPPGKRVKPAMVNVTFVVEQLVKKESEVTVEADNIPLGHDILFFPSRVRVSYYVPMSRYGESAVPIKVVASFKEAFNASSDKVGIHVEATAPYMTNVELKQDSVEYTVVKSN